MSKTEKGDKCKDFRATQKQEIELQKAVNYFKPDDEMAQKHIRIMRGFRPNSEMPGNDR